MFVYFTEILGKKVRDAATRRILGRPWDVVASGEEVYPPVLGVTVRAGARRSVFVPWQRIGFMNGEILVEGGADAPAPPTEGTLSVRRHILDRQIIDTFGARVVRVNDVHLLQVEGELRLIHVDVGASGLFRRLGWLRGVNILAQGLFDYTLKDHLIPWKYVQLLGYAGRGPTRQVLRLSRNHAPLAQLHPAELAEILEELDQHKRQVVFDSLSPELAADALEQMDTETQVDLIEGMGEEQAARVVGEMAADEAADLLGELGEEKAETILDGMEAERSVEVRELLRHEEDTAGGLMTTDFVALKMDYTVDETIAHLRQEAGEAESISYLYVLDDLGHLVGVVTLRRLIVAAPERRMSELMITRVVSVRVDEPAKDTAEVFLKYRFRALPVVDADDVMKGIVTVDDVLEAVAPEELSK